MHRYVTTGVERESDALPSGYGFSEDRNQLVCACACVRVFAGGGGGRHRHEAALSREENENDGFLRRDRAVVT